MAEVKTSEPIAVVGKRYALTFSDFARIPQLVGEAIPEVKTYLAGQGITPTEPAVFEYVFHDSPHGPVCIRDGKFTLLIALPVPQPVAPPAPLEYLMLPAFRHIELISNTFGDSWRQVREATEQAGHERSLIEREVYYAFYGEGHPDTRVGLQVGVQDTSST